MAVVASRYYNDPALGQAFSNLAQMFAPPSAQDVYAYSKAKETKENASRLAELFDYSKQPGFNQAEFDRRAIAAGRYNPNQSYYAVDEGHRVLRDNNAADNTRALQQTGMQQQGETERTLLAPVAAGATRFVPPSIASMFGVPDTQVGVLSAGQGETVRAPNGQTLAGAPKPLTDDQWKAAEAERLKKSGQLTDDMLVAQIMGSTPTTTVVGDNGKPRMAFSTAAAAAGATPAPDVSKAADLTGNLRKEIHALPSYKNLAQAAPIYRSMAETAGRNTKASDLNLVYGLGKIMDPTSVVREGEMIMVKNTASLPDWLQGAINQLNGGAALSPETRAAIMQEAHSRIQSYSDLFQRDVGQYGEIADRNGVNRADVLPSFPEVRPYSPAAEGAPVRKTVNGRTFQREADGNWYEVQ